jgi:hypothetical protein
MFLNSTSFLIRKNLGFPEILYTEFRIEKERNSTVLCGIPQS